MNMAVKLCRTLTCARDEQLTSEFPPCPRFCHARMNGIQKTVRCANVSESATIGTRQVLMHDDSLPAALETLAGELFFSDLSKKAYE